MSIPTPFHQDGAIDFDGVANLVEVGIAGGTQVSLLTAGDSQFFYMTEAEIAELTRFVIERVAGRTLVVAATGRWHTAKAVEFAEFSRDAGADVLMLLPPVPELEPEGLAPLFTAVARVMPVMLVGFPPYALLDMLLDEPAICCFKEDGLDSYAFQTIQRYGGRFRDDDRRSPQPVHGSVDLWLPRLHGLVHQFRSPDRRPVLAALEAGDVETASGIVKTVETPLFSIGGHRTMQGSGTYQGGWQSLWRTLMELNGVASRHLRSPRSRPPRPTSRRVRPALERLGLIGSRTG